MTLKKFNKCLEKIRHSDRAGYECLFNEYYNRMLFTALSKTGNFEDARDIVSDFLTYIFENADSITVTENPDGWVIKAIYNRSVDFIRKNGRTVSLNENLESQTQNNTDPVLSLILIESINELKEHERDLFFLRYVYGYKIKEIASKINVSAGTIKSQLSEIRTKLSHLKKYL